jgi:hypothetical protein
MVKDFKSCVILLVAMSLALHALIPHHHHATEIEKIRCHSSIHPGCDLNVDAGDDHQCNDDIHFDHKLDVEHSILKKFIASDLECAYDFNEFSITSEFFTPSIVGKKNEQPSHVIALNGRLPWPSNALRGPPSVA